MSIPIRTEQRPDSEIVLEEKKALLLAEISTLGQTLENLDSVVANHEAQGKQFEDLSSSIEAKKQELVSLQKSFDALLGQHAVLKNQHTTVQASLDEKTPLLEEIEKYKRMIKTLQAEYLEFKPHHEAMKSQVEVEANQFKAKLAVLKKDAEQLLGRI